MMPHSYSKNSFISASKSTAGGDRGSAHLLILWGAPNGFGGSRPFGPFGINRIGDGKPLYAHHATARSAGSIAAGSNRRPPAAVVSM